VHDEQPLFHAAETSSCKSGVWFWPLAQCTAPPAATIRTRAPPLVCRPFGRLALRSPPHSTPPHHPTPQTENIVFHLRAL
jgi:hypothetical protein